MIEYADVNTLKQIEWGGVRKFLLPYVNVVWGSTA